MVRSPGCRDHLDADLAGVGAEVVDVIGKRLARFVGSNYNAPVSDGRHLFLACTDTDSFNNLGFVTANFANAPVPEPQPEQRGHRHQVHHQGAEHRQRDDVGRQRLAAEADVAVVEDGGDADRAAGQDGAGPMTYDNVARPPLPKPDKQG